MGAATGKDGWCHWRYPPSQREPLRDFQEAGGRYHIIRAY